MSDSGELCGCGRPAQFLGRCEVCFGQRTQTSYGREGPSGNPTRFRPGERFGGGRFTLVEPLGEGGMGAVWLADDEQLSAEGALEQVALKFILGDGVPQAELVALLRKEVRAALRLSHTNIVRVHSWHEHPGEPVFYSMEFVPGMDLKRLLATQATGRFSCAELDPLLFQLVEALNYAHEQAGLVHRDLKPANFLVTPNGRLKLADFGLTRPPVVGDVEANLAGGTWAYASPEQRRGRAPTVADDLYSLGAVLYHLLTGHTPFASQELLSGETPPPPVHPWRLLGGSSQRRRDITPEAAATLLRCLAEDPAERPPTARAFWHWWKTGPPPPESQDSDRWFRWMAKIALGGALLVLLFVGAWKSGLDRAMEPRFPGFVAWVRKLVGTQTTPRKVVPSTEEVTNITPPIVLTDSNNAPVSATDATTRSVALTLHHDAADRGRVLLDLFRISETDAAVATPVASRDLASGAGWLVTNLPPGRYRVEAGTGTVRSASNWVQQELVLAAGATNVAMDIRPGGLVLFLSDPAPFDLFDAWGHSVATVGTNNYTHFSVPPEAKSPWRVDSLFGRKLLAGRYRLRLTEWATNMLHLAAHEEILTVSAGRRSTSSVVLPPWATPRPDSDWTNSVGQHLLPVTADGVRFLAARTETTVQEFTAFAAVTHLPDAPLESVTARGFTNVGKTWRDAFAGQGPSHPVVGVSWFEAVAFCDWLTERERALGQLTAKQHYRLPTAAEWTALAGPQTYPWGDGFPPEVRQGNYAGRELADADWPPTWGQLLLPTTDLRSPHTVPVGSYADADRFADLGGNVAEWCDTWYRAVLNDFRPWRVPSARLADDHGGQFYRVVRGGSWFDQDEDLLRTAAHWAERPDTRNDRVGFRVVLVETP